MHKSAKRLFYSVLLGSLLFFAALPVYAAKLVWKPTRFVADELNSKSFCTMNTEYPVYKTGVTSVYVELTNNTKKMIDFGRHFTLERKQADGWYYSDWEYNAGDPVYAFTADGFVVHPKGTSSMRTSFDIWGGPLPNGEYRIIKKVYHLGDGENDGYFSAYFRVDDSGYDAEFLSGYAPLNLLPKEYDEQSAIDNGDFYVDVKGKAHNAAAVKTFLEKAISLVEAKVRLYSTDNVGSPIITDVTYRGGGVFPAFLVERDESRTNSGRIVVKSYYSMLRTRKVNGKTGIYLANTNKKEHTLSVEELLMPNVATVGKSLAAKAEKEFMQTDYTVLSDDPRIFFHYNGEEFAWWRTTATGGSELRTCKIMDDEDRADKLLRMTFTGKDEVTLIFSCKGQKKTYCKITFDIAQEAVTSIEYTENI